MDSEFYHSKMEQISKDENIYKKLEKNIDKEMLNKINDLSVTHKEELTKKEIKYLINFNYKMSQLYGLPKIHKMKRTNDEIHKTKTD